MTKTRRSWALRGGMILVAAIAVTACAGPASTGTASTGTARTVPAAGSPSASQTTPGQATYLPDPRHRMLLGTFIDLKGEPDAETAIEKQEAAIGRRYNLELTYYRWNDLFPDFGEAAMAAHGRTPVMTWYGPGKDRNDHRTLAEINDGHDDAWILRQAEAIKAFGHVIYLRLMPEMNGGWYPGFSGQPAAYVKAWRRVYNLFRQAGARNVVWVWNPNVTPSDWDPYYPGNAYVDIIGVDGFSNVKFGWQTFQQMFGGFLAHFAGRKPLMIGETATDSGAGDPRAGIGSAADFINGMHSYLKRIAGPRYGVVAVCWFDTNAVDGHDWRVDQTPAAWRAWLSLARDPYFGGHGS